MTTPSSVFSVGAMCSFLLAFIPVLWTLNMVSSSVHKAYSEANSTTVVGTGCFNPSKSDFTDSVCKSDSSGRKSIEPTGLVSTV